MSAARRSRCWPRWVSRAPSRLSTVARAASPTSPSLSFRHGSQPSASLGLVTELEPITAEEFGRLSEFLYRRTGMIFTEAKRYFVQRRVDDRMKATGAKTFASYFARLRSDASGEIEQFVNAFTINETYFYREEHQLRCLTADLLSQRVRAKRRG